MNNKVIFAVKIILLAFGFISGLFSVEPVDPNALPNPLIFFVLSPIMLTIVLGPHAYKARKTGMWDRVKWASNPLNLNQPLQFFHFAAWTFVVGGIGMIASSLFTENNFKYGLVLCSVGISTLLAVKILEYFCVRK